MMLPELRLLLAAAPGPPCRQADYCISSLKTCLDFSVVGRGRSIVVVQQDDSKDPEFTRRPRDLGAFPIALSLGETDASGVQR
jgi:hypothetical protein